MTRLWKTQLRISLSPYPTRTPAERLVMVQLVTVTFSETDRLSPSPETITPSSPARMSQSAMWIFRLEVQ